MGELVTMSRSLMFPEPAEIIQRGATLIADRGPSVTSVCRRNMVLQSPFIPKGFTAVLTDERLLPGVNAGVSVKLPSIPADETTNTALVNRPT